MLSMSHLSYLGWFVGGKWLYIWCFVGRRFQDLFKTECSILLEFPSNFFSKHFKDLVVQPYSSTDIATTWMNSNFIPSERSDFHMIVMLLIVFFVLPMCMLTLFLENVIWLLTYMNLSNKKSKQKLLGIIYSQILFC